MPSIVATMKPIIGSKALHAPIITGANGLPLWAISYQRMKITKSPVIAKTVGFKNLPTEKTESANPNNNIIVPTHFAFVGEIKPEGNGRSGRFLQSHS